MTDILFNKAADILENGEAIPSRVSNGLLAAMLKQTHGEAKEAKREARCAKDLAKDAVTKVEMLGKTMALRLGLVGGGATIVGGVVVVISFLKQ
jgi:hypothetical protein